MNPKIEVVKMNIQKKGQQVGTFSARVAFDGGFEVILPGMRVVEGAKGVFVDLPSRKFKEVGFVPFYYLNKPMRDLVTREGLAAYELAVKEKKLDQAGGPVEVASKAVVTVATAKQIAAVKPVATAKSWPRKEWRPTYQKK